MKPFYEYNILHKTGWHAATGFHCVTRVKKWLNSFNAQMYNDKTLKVEDFIVMGHNEDGWFDVDLSLDQN